MKKYIKIKFKNEKLIVCKKNMTKEEQIKLQEYIDIRFKNSFSNLSLVLDRTYRVMKIKKNSIKIYYTNFDLFQKSILALEWRLFNTPSHENMLNIIKYFPELNETFNKK